MVNRIYKLYNSAKLFFYKTKAIEILRDKKLPKYFDNDSFFYELQNSYPPRSNYFYDNYNSWKRGVERAQKILETVELRNPGLKVLEVACGDGMTGYALSQYGHAVTLNDITDWRDRRSKSMNYIEGNICQTLPLPSNLFDIIVSFNSFEHLDDPAAAMAEIHRLAKPNGIIVLEFGPLFLSPWGLHAYRTIHMPYAQHLFSEGFLSKKFQEIGLKDLGKEMDSLQPLNKWRVKEFLELWDNPKFTTLDLRLNNDFSHLGIVIKYQQSFCGLGLDIRDLITQSISVILKKNMSIQ